MDYLSALSDIDIATVCVTPFRQNCSLLICKSTKQAVVIDPGGDFAKIKAMIINTKASLQYIILTHGHLDHCGAALEMSIEFKVPIYGPHILDAFLLKDIKLQAALFRLPLTSSFYPNCWLNDSDKIKFGKQILDVLHCPGHTPGHIAFFHRSASIAFVGDILFSGSVGRTDLPRSNKRDLLLSITDKLWPLGNKVKIYPGHGEATTIGDERKNNPFVSDANIAYF